MATITSLNQYKASYPDATDMSVAAGSMEDALVALKEAKDMEPSMLQKTVTGIAVAIPAPAGCKATPYTIDSVENGDKVWFTAIAVDGFTFSGWYLGEELKSSDESYEATIAYAGTTPTTLKYEARFVVA